MIDPTFQKLMENAMPLYKVTRLIECITQPDPETPTVRG